MISNIRQICTTRIELPKLILLGLLFLSIGCSSTDSDSLEIDSTDLKIELTKDRVTDILSQMKAIGDKEGKIVTFSMADIKTKDAVSKMELSFISKKGFIFNEGSDRTFTSPGDDYSVTCTWGNGETTVTVCGDDIACAGSATWDCLENGGCATLCNNKLMYVPSSYKAKASKMDQLMNIMRSVESQSKNSNGDSFSVKIDFDKDNFWLNSTTKINKPISIPSRNWQVDCFDSDGELMWSDTFSVQHDASDAMVNCTNDGGCAGICTIDIKYFGTGRG